jgi:hypothetical protein
MPPSFHRTPLPRAAWLRRAAACLAVALALPACAQTTNVVLGWNNLGMHCMDSDYGVFSILPPYNTIHAQIVRASGSVARLVTNATGYTVSYCAVGDPDLSTNTTSIGKTTFWDGTNTVAFFGVALAPDQGLPVPGPSYYMPGATNAQRQMAWDGSLLWHAAYGVPITPYDDTLRKNPYPLLQFMARTNATVLAANNIVLPVSDEMDCRACHASGRPEAAQPSGGWVWEPNPERDYRLNILRRHDEQRGTSAVYRAALAANQFHPDGLLLTVLRSGTPVLCARCHLSEALPGSGIAGIPPLTAAVHARHSTVADPETGLALDATTNRTACYRCHPGAVTRCLRGAMGNAIATNGLPSMQCQSCHGRLSDVGRADRTGWLDEPSCQQCHSGTATHNNGQIRYTSVFAAPGVPRTNVDATFATSSNTPLPGISLFRFSRGHGGLYCEACHGSTHAEFPSAHRNDNLYALQHQGHVGVLAECTSCHGTTPPSTAYTNGPHGMHPIGQQWVLDHHDNGAKSAGCLACHGADQRGTVLSRAHGVRTLTANFGTTITRTTWRGYQVNCYLCHRGSGNSNATANQPPVAQSRTAATAINTPVSIPLLASDADGPAALTNRIVTQPAGGTVALVPGQTNAWYTPGLWFGGTDTFTYAAFDGELDSNLATVTVTVAGGPYLAVVAPTSFVCSAIGGVYSTKVTAASATAWDATANHYWLRLLPGATGVGTGHVIFAVAPMTGTVARSGTLTVAGQVVAVRQDPALSYDTNRIVITAIRAEAGAAAAVDYTTTTNRLLQLEATADLRTDCWLGVRGALPGDGQTRHDQDPAATNRLQRFYRVRLYP